MPGAIEVHGIAELQRAFARASTELSNHLADELIDAARPVAQEAQQLAFTQIRNMPSSPEWAEMRVGVARRQADVYVVPRAKGRNRRVRHRPNLARLLMERALEPALEAKRSEVLARVEQLVDRSLDLADLT